MKHFLHILVNVNSVWTFKYLLWLIQETDGREVSIGVASYRAFFQYLHRNGIKPPTERTMRIVLGEMIHDKIVFRLKGNMYRINSFIIDGQDEVSVNHLNEQEPSNQ